MTFENCTFYDNNATAQGGAIYNESAVVTVRNCTFSKNQAKTSAGAIANGAGSSLTITNSILWGDKVGATTSEVQNLGGIVTVTYSDIQGSTTGAGNLNADPQFVDAAGGLLALKPTSPCIDKGNNANLAAWDLELNPRLMDGDGGGPLWIWEPTSTTRK